MATLTPMTVGNAAAPNEWDSAPNGALGDNSDSTFGARTNNATGTVVQGWELGNVDADLGNVDTLSIVLRYAWSASVANSVWDTLEARVVSGATILAAANAGGTLQTFVTNITTTTPTNSGTAQFTFVNTSANKAAWDAAVVEIRITRTRTKGGDAAAQRVYEADLTGTYTAGAAPEEHSGTLAVTGGGSLTAVAAKGAVAALAVSGGGDTTITAQRGAETALGVSGGGSVDLSASTERPAALSVSGGGSFTFSYSADTGDVNVNASFAVSGGGSVTESTTTDRPMSLAVSGGGAAEVTATSERSSALAISGGGEATLAPLTARSDALSVSGGGSVSISATADTGVEEHSGSFSVSGGGGLAAQTTTERAEALVVTGGGSTALGPETARFASLSISGGGFVDLTHSASWGDAKSGELGVSGGGGVNIEALTARLTSLGLTGGGEVAVASSTTRYASLVISGGGSISVSSPFVPSITVIHVVIRPLGVSGGIVRRQSRGSIVVSKAGSTVNV